jgi:hypothetical protein
MLVTQPTPARRPMTTWGTTKTDVPAAGSNAMLAKMTGPEPGMLSSSSTSSPDA